jgi:excisionase family DNA binding protein
LKFLFVPLYDQNTIYPVYYIPDAFEETPIGQLLNQARVRCLTMADVVTVTRAAKLAQVSRSEIYSWIEAGRLHPVEMDGRQMIDRDELRSWTQITEEPGEAN